LCGPLQASIEPSLTGISSSPTPHGIINRINRTLFGGRLIYYGPAYLINLLAGPINIFNTSRCFPVSVSFNVLPAVGRICTAMVLTSCPMGLVLLQDP
jgi:hypothetical protein